VVIWIGANDLDDALNALTTDPSGATSLVIIEDALSAIAVNAQILYRAGARMFLIANIPDLSKTPYVQFVGQTDPTIPTIASQFTNTFNVELAAGATAFGRQPGIQYFQLFDVDGLLNRVIAAPEEFHLIDVTDRCTVPGVLVHAICNETDSFLFWDAAHPTTAGHRIVAAAALSLLPPQ
jgi:phospholipase/lecithinase/hemolysin